MLSKQRPIRLKGVKLKQLNDYIHQRDQHCCVLEWITEGQRKWVDPGEKFHHVIFKSHGGSDTKENGATLCMDCHRLAHGEQAESIRQILLGYLEQIYCTNKN
jgi:5-methylcytosine-specific restriction endonuclease McrA